MKFDFPEDSSGFHPPTAAIARILQFKGVKNPITDQYYSEALLLGIGGGIDAGYILYQFPHLPQPLLLLGFRNQWNHTRAFLEELTERLSLTVSFEEFEDRESAQEGLLKNVIKDQPTIVWVDKSELPHHHLPGHLAGLMNYQVTVLGYDDQGGTFYVDDLSCQPLEINDDVLSNSREKLSQNNFLMMAYGKAENLSANEMREAIIEGIRSCSVRLNNPMKTIGISNLETWAEKLIDRHDRQGWPQIFGDQKGLYNALKTIYMSIKLDGTDGFALRKLYADFLHESAVILNNPTLNAITGQYLQLSRHWSNLAENALPSKFPEFDKIKSLLNKKYQSYKNYQMKTYTETITRLKELEDGIILDFPLEVREIDQLFERLSRQVQLIAELEINAALRLRDITRPK